MNFLKKILKSNSLLYSITLKIYHQLLRMYDNLTSIECNVSIGDLMLKRNELGFGPFISVSRYLDVARYCSGKGYFVYEAALSDKRVLTKELDLSNYKNEDFESLIKSVKENGYQEDSILNVDKELKLYNGTHRMGICLYYGIYNVQVKIINRKSKLTQDYFFKRDIESELLTKINQEYYKVEKLLIDSGQTFCMIANDCSEDQMEDIKLDMNILSRVLNTVERDNNLMIQFALNEPKYKYQKAAVISDRSREIDQLLRKRYSNCKIRVSLNCSEGAKLHKEFMALNKD